jgi:hypothetical protein
MIVYVVRDQAGNVHGVVSDEPSHLGSSYTYESHTLDACIECGAEIALDCTCEE